MGRAGVTGHLAVSPGCAGAAAGAGSRPGHARLAGLPDALSAGAERLLIGASVYREPADRSALLFQVGRHDWTAARAPGRLDPTPPYQEPAGLDDMIAVCEAAGLLTVSFAAPDGQPGRPQLNCIACWLLQTGDTTWPPRTGAPPGTGGGGPPPGRRDIAGTGMTCSRPVITCS